MGIYGILSKSLCVNIKYLRKFSDPSDDTTFFLQTEKYVTEVLNNFNIMSPFSGFKVNKSKCEVSETEVMKRVKVALCGVE